MPRKKSVLITGASRGIGKAMAYEFAKNGYNLYLTCKNNLKLLEEIKYDLEKETSLYKSENIPKYDSEGNIIPDVSHSIQCRIFQCDMGNAKEVETLFESIPTIDIIVNNAGISHVGLLTDMTCEEWRKIMATNIDSLFYTSKFGVPKMLQKHSGKIINISSIWGNVGASMEVAYSASKGAVNSFTKALSKELGPSNIQVNTIACGLINTDMNSCFSAEDLQSVIDEIPADRMGTPEEVAKLCVILAEAPEYLTGQIISLDGGWM